MAQSLRQLTTETMQGRHRVSDDQMGSLPGREEGVTRLCGIMNVKREYLETSTSISILKPI